MKNVSKAIKFRRFQCFFLPRIGNEWLQPETACRGFREESACKTKQRWPDIQEVQAVCDIISVLRRSRTAKAKIYKSFAHIMWSRYSSSIPLYPYTHLLVLWCLNKIVPLYWGLFADVVLARGWMHIRIFSCNRLALPNLLSPSFLITLPFRTAVASAASRKGIQPNFLPRTKR